MINQSAIGACLLSFFVSVQGFEQAANDATPTDVVPQTLTPRAVQQFADSFFDEEMASLNVPGAVFVVAQGNEVLFQRGYGLSTVEPESAVDAENSLFHVASVSKLVTATAVMQLVDAGNVDLSTDINRYLTTMQVETAYGQPITLSHLLTHTAGFDERNLGYVSPSAATVKPLATYLQERMPPTTQQPGDVVSYSNHGFGLVGLVVEEVTGKPFAQYVKDRVFAPLKMNHSTFDTNTPPELSRHLVTGYRRNKTSWHPVEPHFRNVPPAGAMRTSGADMGHFMLAHLNSGGVLLTEPAADQMVTQQFTHHPQLPGMGYGFMEQYQNGHRVLQHSGGAPGFSSILVLIPEQQIGFFMAANLRSNQLRQKLVRHFMARFFPPRSAIEPLPTRGADPSLSRFEGAYRLSRYSRRTLEKLPAVFANEYVVYADVMDGSLVTEDGARWVEVEPLLFRDETGTNLIAFREDDGGRITFLFRSIDLGGHVPGAYERLSWYETKTFVNEFFLSWVPFVLLTWVLWPVSAGTGKLWRLFRRIAPSARTSRIGAASWIASVFGICSIWFAFGFVQPFVQAVQRGGENWSFGVPADKAALLAIPVLLVFLLVPMFFFTVKSWREQRWNLFWRLHYSVFTLAAVCWVFFLQQYNLIGWKI